MPKSPPADWNYGLVAKNPIDGQPHFARVFLARFSGVQNTWHETFVDYSDLLIGQKLRTGIYEARASSLNNVVIAKFARFPWEIQYIENETTAYQWIVGHDIGPRFLGHLTENSRVIDFLLKRFIDSRHAGVQHIDIRARLLSRLHDLRIRHGDTNRFNFLVRNSKAILIDFDTSQKFDDSELLSQELENLSTCLGEPSGRGGGGIA